MWYQSKSKQIIWKSTYPTQALIFPVEYSWSWAKEKEADSFALVLKWGSMPIILREYSATNQFPTLLRTVASSKTSAEWLICFVLLPPKASLRTCAAQLHCREGLTVSLKRRVSLEKDQNPRMKKYKNHFSFSPVEPLRTRRTLYIISNICTPCPKITSLNSLCCDLEKIRR